jgi:predicted Co/Zn/Cd cation transporter (cation efflux family)
VVSNIVVFKLSGILITILMLIATFAMIYAMEFRGGSKLYWGLIIVVWSACGLVALFQIQKRQKRKSVQ